MQVEEVKAILNRYRFIAGDISDNIEELQRLRSLAENITPTLSQTPPCGGDYDKITNAVARIIEVEEHISKLSEELFKVRMQAQSLINLVENPLHRQLLVKRYVLGKKWETICVDLNYGWQGIHKVHHRALVLIGKRVDRCPPQPMI